MVSGMLLGMVIAIVVMLAVGLYVSTMVRGDSVNYIVAGRGLILPLAAATLMAQSLDANATLGNTDLTYNFGFWAGASLPIGLAGCLFLTGLFFAKPMNKMDLITLPDFYRRKYGRTVEIAASVILALSFALLLGGNLVAGGFLFVRFAGLEFWQGVAIITTVIYIYTLTGGLFAVAYTDIVQAVVALVGSLGLIWYVGTTYGITIPEGMGPMVSAQLSDPALGAWVNWATIGSLMLGDIVAIDFMERVFAADSPKTAQRAAFVGAAGTLIIGIPFAFVALSADSIFAQIGYDATVRSGLLYVILEQSVPVVLGATVLAGIIAASMSTGDGAILGTSSVMARNVMGIHVEEDMPMDEEEAIEQRGEGMFGGPKMDRLLRATRLWTIPIALLGVLFAIRVPATGMLLVLAFDIQMATAFVPLVGGLYFPNFSNPPAALSAFVTGAVTRVGLFALSPVVYGTENTLLYFQNPWITAAFDGKPTFIAFGVGLVTFIVVGLLTRNTHEPIYVDEHPIYDTSE